MFIKNYSKSGKICRVTFKCENPDSCESAILVGDFNNWSLQETPMKKLKNGSFSTTLSLKTGTSHQFLYVLDGGIWRNDEKADGHVANPFGGENSVVTV
ncbi:isoamylase early set domain-containing protein [Desulfopila sp. IMCC35008]|uniref:isoamylase early set domain-containing protein n=1 Tax=Desulfopila sp. IMCC35008 TaxID=2653858 RepID=UPI0013D05F4E|nr:isoamylase early set domain-containing protein [Desulfopila sp. IMCC35008]